MSVLPAANSFSAKKKTGGHAQAAFPQQVRTPGGGVSGVGIDNIDPALPATIPVEF